MNFNKLHIVLPGEIREKCPVFFLKSLLRINYLYNPLPLNKVLSPRLIYKALKINRFLVLFFCISD